MNNLTELAALPSIVKRIRHNIKLYKNTYNCECIFFAGVKFAKEVEVTVKIPKDIEELKTTMDQELCEPRNEKQLKSGLGIHFLQSHILNPNKFVTTDPEAAAGVIDIEGLEELFESDIVQKIIKDFEILSQNIKIYNEGQFPETRYGHFLD